MKRLLLCGLVSVLFVGPTVCQPKDLQEKREQQNNKILNKITCNYAVLSGALPLAVSVVTNPYAGMGSAVWLAVIADNVHNKASIGGIAEAEAKGSLIGSIASLVVLGVFTLLS